VTLGSLRTCTHTMLVSNLMAHSELGAYRSFRHSLM
jgi:hypothetical protein